MERESTRTPVPPPDVNRVCLQHLLTAAINLRTIMAITADQRLLNEASDALSVVMSALERTQRSAGIDGLNLAAALEAAS